MSILFRIFGWLGGIVSSIFGMWMSKKVMEKTMAAQGTPQATEESKEDKT